MNHFYTLPNNFRITPKSEIKNSFAAELVKMDERIVCYNMLANRFDEASVNRHKHFYMPFKNVILISDEMIPKLSHQIAHMVEMNNFSRCVQHDWNFGTIDKMTSDKFSTKFYVAAMLREIRVRAIDHHISDVPFIRGKFKLGGAAWRPTDIPIKSFPFGRFKDQKDFIEFCSALEERTYNAWSKEKVRVEWIKRLDYIRNWMETIEDKIAALIKEFINRCLFILQLLFHVFTMVNMILLKSFRMDKLEETIEEF
jgi:hypothetical protein